MSDQTDVTTISKTAGLLYLLVIIFGMFSEVYVSQKFLVPGDPVETSKNIITSQFLYRIGFVADLIHHTCFFLVSITLYLLFREVNKSQALVMMLFKVINTWGILLSNNRSVT